MNNLTQQKDKIEEARAILIKMVQDGIIHSNDGTTQQVETSKGKFNFEVDFEKMEAVYTP